MAVLRPTQAESRKPCFYIFVIVKVPFPVQPPLPVRAHVPEIVLPLAVPLSASVLPDGSPDCTFMPNAPFTVSVEIST